MTAIFDSAIFDPAIFDTEEIVIDLPFDWAPPVNLATSTIIDQALRYMQLAPIARHDPASELLPALVDAFDTSIDECLAACDWSFASVLAFLPAADAPVTAEPDMDTLAMLPGDLIELRELRPRGARWRVDGARLLRTDAPAPVLIRYTARVTWEPALPAAFRTAVALHIALRLGARWAGGNVRPDDLAEAALTTLKQAMRDDAVQASQSRLFPPIEDGSLPDMGYGLGQDDWAMEAVA